MSQDILQAIATRNARVAVVGLGYVGLPLAVGIAEAGFSVVGVDLSERRVEEVNRGESTIGDVSSGRLRKLRETGRIVATTDFADTADATVAVIAVPTPIDVHRVPDLSYVSAATAGLVRFLGRGALVVLESTTYPGTTDEILVPAFRARGMEPGADVFVAYSPERIDPGNENWHVSNTPKLLAGTTAACAEAATAFYSTFVDSVIPVSSTRTAEMAKLFENIFRVVNIALVNEFQIICDALDIDVWEVIAACSTKPYGFMPFYPGPGLGGHCVPVDPFYLAWKAREKNVNTEFIELAGRVNSLMPGYVVKKLTELLNSAGLALRGARVAVLGVAYKRETGDMREAPAERILDMLHARGANLSYHDPYVASLSVGGRALDSQPLTEGYLVRSDCVLVLTDHRAIDWSLVAANSRLLLDTRNVVPPAADPH